MVGSRYICPTQQDFTGFNEDQNPSENWEITSSWDQWESCIGQWGPGCVWCSG